MHEIRKTMMRLRIDIMHDIMQYTSHEIHMPALYTKRLMRVTLDVMCYEDLDLETLDWREVLNLNSDEDININIEEYDIDW